VVQGTGVGRQFELEGREVIIGRQPDVDLHLDAREVSRRHARILIEGSQYFLEDLESSNGTFVNSIKLQGKTALQPQDQIRMGPYLFRFEATPTSEVDVVIRAETVAQTSNLDLFRGDAGRKLQAVLEIAHQMARSLNLDELLSRVLESLFRLFPQADRGLILMVEGDQQVVRAMQTRRMAQTPGPAYSRSVVRRVLEGGVGIVAEDAAADSRFVTTQTLNNLGIRSFLCVPLKVHDGRPLGVLQMDRVGFGAPFTRDDLDLLTAVSLQISVVLENAALHAELLEKELEKERMQREMALAREIQEGFLPQELAPLPAGQADLFARVYPAMDVSGDFYDFFPLDDRRIAFAVADVSGKGIPAALFMTGVRALSRHLAQQARTPARVLQELNDALAGDNPTAMFVTMAFGTMDVTTGDVVISSGGHPPAVLRGTDGRVEEVEMPPGRLLGFSKGALPLTDTRLRLGPGDTLMLYTDGVTEALGGSDGRTMFGIERLQSTLRGLPAGQPLEAWGHRIRAQVDQFSSAETLKDDITLLLLRRLPL
jgi:serine phosphatase RsbU (regulator of sigma subunit)